MPKKSKSKFAKIKTMLLEQSKRTTSKRIETTINDIETEKTDQRKIAIEEVARVLHQVSSSKG